MKYKQIEVVKYLRICKMKWLRKLAGGSQVQTASDVFRLLIEKSKSFQDSAPKPRKKVRRRKSLYPGAKLC